ncbi:MAG: FtsX-like permease family protein [Deltaproteobacteria bacterium]|nr:FtsX-like permease family protein [Deltaproteobacteria bacterium]
MISPASTLTIALRALRANKMRSSLTMLGIIIGVAAVIAMLSIGAAARQRIADEINSMGSNLLIVFSGSTSSGGARMGTGTDPTISLEDVEAMLRECPSVLDAAPMHSGSAQIVYGNRNWSTGIIGTTASVLHINAWEMLHGRAFTPQDERYSAKVCLLGMTVADELFGAIDPVGRIVRIKHVPFRVLGVLKPKGQSMTGQDQDDVVYVPITTAQRKLFGGTLPGMVRFVMVKATGLHALDQAEQEIVALLRHRHRIGPGQTDDFTVRNLTQMMQIAITLANIMTILLGAIASISLLVGGIGIMNIMLVSVTERTREIGIRIAVGAKTWDIRLQFIMEAMTLSLIGGLIGIVLGQAGSIGLCMAAGLPVHVSAAGIALSFGFSAAVGIFFGYYPAHKASLLNPIDALRYE